jgi:hypothetical protein
MGCRLRLDQIGYGKQENEDEDVGELLGCHVISNFGRQSNGKTHAFGFSFVLFCDDFGKLFRGPAPLAWRILSGIIFSMRIYLRSLDPLL